MRVVAAAISQKLEKTIDTSIRSKPLTAVACCVKVVRVVAASYCTAWEDAFRSSKMLRIHLG